MPLTQQDLELERTALELIRRQALPAQMPRSVWSFPGSGKPCSLCARPIDALEMEQEFEAPLAAGIPTTFRMHLRCHALWQLEVARLLEN